MGHDKGDVFRDNEITCKKTLYILAEITEVLFMKIFFQQKYMIFPCNNL